MTGKQKRYLRAQAHPLKPVVNLGKQGLSQETRREKEVQLLDHELIKLKVLDSCPLTKKECADELSRAKSLEVVQVIGKTLVLYCPPSDEPEIELPAT
jgi:RNA-binding protein